MFSLPLVGLVCLFISIFESVAGLRNVTIQEDDARIRFSDGNWAKVSDSDLSRKPSLLGCSDGLMQSTVDGSFLEFNFTGTAIYLNTVDGVRGTFQAVLDDVPFDFDSGKSNTTAAQCRVAYSQTDLQDGPHRLVVFNYGDSSSLLFDSITYTESDPYDLGLQKPGSILQSKGAFTYVPVRPQGPRVIPSGSWEVVDLTSIGERINYCADVVYQTTTIGSSLEFRFNGTAVEFNTLVAPTSGGLVTVSIDGLVEVIDGRGSANDCILAWNSKTLSSEFEHTFIITNTGPADPNESSLLSIASLKYSTTSDDPSVQDPGNNVQGLRPLSPYINYEDQPANPVVIGGAVAAGIFVCCFLGFIFYWAKRDRLKQAARKPDVEKAITGRKRQDDTQKRKELLIL